MDRSYLYAGSIKGWRVKDGWMERIRKFIVSVIMGVQE
jgi:hypothetical protein